MPIPRTILSLLLLACSLKAHAQSYLLDSLDESVVNTAADTYKIVVLPFQFKGISVSTAFTLSKKMGDSLVNTNRFEVIGPEEVENFLIEQNSPLLGCVEISCGIQISKEFEAHYLLVNGLTARDSGDLLLRTRLVEVQLNRIEFEDFLFFDEEEINNSLYFMSNRIIRHVPLIGTVLQANDSSAVITLGRRHNLKVGDQVVIYKQEGFSNSNNLPFDTTLNRTRAIIKVNRVAEFASEGAIIHRYETPDVKDKARMILNTNKQVAMVAQARREIDDAYKAKKEEKLEVVAPVVLKDLSRQEWLRRYRAGLGKRNTLNFLLIGAGLLTAYFYSRDGVNDGKTLLSLAGTAYVGYEYVRAHHALDEIIEEGRFKNYVDNADIPVAYAPPNLPLFRVSYDF